MSDDLSSLLWLAAEKRDSETIKYLLSSYDDIIDINMQDKVFVTDPTFTNLLIKAIIRMEILHYERPFYGIMRSVLNYSSIIPILT